MIHADKIEKHYNHSQAIKGASLSISHGELVGLIGPNGAGKSTLMKILAGTLAPSGGNLTIHGMNYRNKNREIHRRLGYLPETAPIYPEMTGIEFLNFLARARGMSQEESKQRIEYVLDLCSLSQTKNRINKTLSKGYRQRLALAQAILHKPDIYLLDEPTDGLDPIQQKTIHQIIRDLSKTSTVIISTHNLKDVETLCQRVVLLNKGEILRDCPTKDLVQTQNLEEAFFTILSGEV